MAAHKDEARLDQAINEIQDQPCSDSCKLIMLRALRSVIGLAHYGSYAVGGLALTTVLGCVLQTLSNPNPRPEDQKWLDQNSHDTVRKIIAANLANIVLQQSLITTFEERLDRAI
ncbi:MAG TPA: hypothetical protein VLG38_05725, partial [Gammaproteobacteria bacterium]|nr:hypothetical protein [Gammaproteobacteria bacterium]